MNKTPIQHESGIDLEIYRSIIFSLKNSKLEQTMWIASTDSHQLVVVELWSLVVHREPPGSGSNRSRTHVAADGHVSKEEPVADEGLFGIARWFVHNVQVRRIEAEGRGR